MLDPATDDVLAECSGPTADGRCPVSDAPPSTCTGLHLVGTPGTGGRGVSLTVTPCSLDGARSRLPAARHPTARKGTRNNRSRTPGGTPMAWLWWRQHRADRAEMVRIRLYLERRAAQRRLAECIIDARRHDDGIIRLDTGFGSGPVG